MFSYYGSKSKIIDHYPPPRFDKIIEPFAGSARYALKYFDRDVLLVDKYPVIIRIWEWLQQCSKNDILSLPTPKKGESLNDFHLTDVEKWFLGFCVASGCSSPQISVGSFEGIPLNRNCLKNTAENLYKIKHWKFKVGNYLNIENDLATWFIDPPYQFGGGNIT